MIERETSLPLSSVFEGNRRRKDYGDIPALAIELQKDGMLNPITVVRKGDGYLLVSGGRRLRAAKSLKWENIPAKVASDATTPDQIRIELAENLFRKPLEWAEEAQAICDFHDSMMALHGEGQGKEKGTLGQGRKKAWNQEKTAEAIGVNRSSVFRALETARIVGVVPELAKVKDRATAMRQVKQLTKVIANQEKAKSVSADVDLGSALTHGRAEALIRELDEDSIDLIIWDPPYGVDLDKAQSYQGSLKPYDVSDDASSIMALVLDVAREAFRVLKPSGHMFMFCGQTLITEGAIQRVLGDSGFFWHSIPHIWVKERGGYAFQGKTGVNAYETFFHCWKAEERRELSSPHTNVWSYPGVPSAKRIHPTERPLDFMTALVQWASAPGDTVLDPMSGSGVVLEACLRLSRHPVGFEMKEEHYTSSYLRLAEVVQTLSRKE